MKAAFITDINCRAVQSAFECRKAGVIYLCSTGGDTDAARALVDVIETYGLRTAAVGLIQSAALPVFAAGRHRSATAGTQFMWHPPYLEAGRLDVDELNSEAEAVERWAEWAAKLLERRSNLLFQDWVRLAKAHTRFSADRAVEWNLVDTIRRTEEEDPVTAAPAAG